MYKKMMLLIVGIYLFKLFVIIYIYVCVGVVMVFDNFVLSIDYFLVFYYIVVCG